MRPAVRADGRPSPNYRPPGDARRSKFFLEAFEAIQFEADEEWLVKRVLPRQGVAVVYGKSQSFKSFITSDLAWTIAAGWDWAGVRSMQAPVVYIAAEGARGLRKRKEGWTRTHSDIPAPLPFRLVSAAPNLGGENGDLPELIASIEAAHLAPGLIIIDTLAQTIGSGDENGSGMVQYISNAQALASKFAALVVIVHHVGLGDDQRLRGHSSLHGAVDAQLLCERAKGTLSATMKLQKLKDEDSERTFDVSLSRVVIGHDEDGDEVSTLVVDHVAESQSKPMIAKPKAVPQTQRMLMDVIVAALEENGADFRPDGTNGPHVRAVAERAIRSRYNARIAEEADIDEDPDKLADRQRKSFKRAIEAGLKANRIMARQSDGKRLIWLP